MMPIIPMTPLTIPCVLSPYFGRSAIHMPSAKNTPAMITPTPMLLAAAMVLIFDICLPPFCRYCLAGHFSCAQST